MPLEKGSLVLLNYVSKLKDEDRVIDTNVEEVAKECGLYDPTRRYEPMLVCVGEGWVIKGLDEFLLKAEVGQKATVEIPPEKAFGPRDPSKIHMIPLRRLGKDAERVRVGDEIEVNGRIGIVRYVGSGRVQIDFNHRYAGRVLVYEVEVLKKLEERDEKAMALVRRRLPVDGIELGFEDGKVSIELPEAAFLIEGLQIIKRAIASDLFKYLDADEVKFVERYKNPKTEGEQKEEAK